VPALCFNSLNRRAPGFYGGRGAVLCFTLRAGAGLQAPRPIGDTNTMKDAAIPYCTASSPSDPQILALFQDELVRIAAMPGLVAAGPALLPRFVGCYQGLARLPRRLRRQLQRRWRRSLAAIALLLALGQAPALAATINVDGASCTLVDAVTAANINVATGGCTAGSGADTLVLSAGSTHTLIEVKDSTDRGPTGLPAIASVITIEGNGSTIQATLARRNFSSWRYASMAT
jgi:hypothetical protein